MDVAARVDEALERIHAHADEDERGFTSHAPMVVDALVALDRADRIEPFLDVYLPGFPAHGGAPVDAHEAPRAAHDVLDASVAWPDALDRALAELAPSLFSAATHGLLRAAHAARGLALRDTPVRRRELARALAYWHASEMTLPGTPGAASGHEGGIGAADLIGRLEVVPAEQRRPGLFTDGVGVLARWPSFADAIARLEIPAVIDGDAVSELTRAMLAPYFESPLLRIAYVHTITAPSSLRLVSGHVRPETLSSLYAHGVQAVAALHAISRSATEHEIGAGTRRLARDVEALKTRAADTLEEHVIKFTEACLREHAASCDERFLLAAADMTTAEEQRETAAPSD